MSLERKYTDGSALVVRGNDIDTDRIIPARYMKVVTFDGIGKYAFYDVRYGHGGKVLDHPFNSKEAEKAEILVVNKNFGCGSSREHAPQALQRFGINGIIGESFAEIFSGNCTVMGIPVVTLSASDVEALMIQIDEDPSIIVTIDLKSSVVLAGERHYSCSLPESRRKALLAGTWDSTSALLSQKETILALNKDLPY